MKKIVKVKLAYQAYKTVSSSDVINKLFYLISRIPGLSKFRCNETTSEFLLIRWFRYLVNTVTNSNIISSFSLFTLLNWYIPFSIIVIGMNTISAWNCSFKKHIPKPIKTFCSAVTLALNILYFPVFLVFVLFLNGGNFFRTLLNQKAKDMQQMHQFQPISSWFNRIIYLCFHALRNFKILHNSLYFINKYFLSFYWCNFIGNTNILFRITSFAFGVWLFSGKNRVAHLNHKSFGFMHSPKSNMVIQHSTTKLDKLIFTNLLKHDQAVEFMNNWTLIPIMSQNGQQIVKQHTFSIRHAELSLYNIKHFFELVSILPFKDEQSSSYDKEEEVLVLQDFINGTTSDGNSIESVGKDLIKFYTPYKFHAQLDKNSLDHLTRTHKRLNQHWNSVIKSRLLKTKLQTSNDELHSDDQNSKLDDHLTDEYIKQYFDTLKAYLRELFVFIFQIRRTGFEIVQHVNADSHGEHVALLIKLHYLYYLYSIHKEFTKGHDRSFYTAQKDKLEKLLELVIRDYNDTANMDSQESKITDQLKNKLQILELSPIVDNVDIIIRREIIRLTYHKCLNQLDIIENDMWLNNYNVQKLSNSYYSVVREEVQNICELYSIMMIYLTSPYFAMEFLECLQCPLLFYSAFQKDAIDTIMEMFSFVFD